MERVLTIALPHLCQFECQLTGYAVKDMAANSSNCWFLSPLMPVSPCNVKTRPPLLSENQFAMSDCHIPPLTSVPAIIVQQLRRIL